MPEKAKPKKTGPYPQAFTIGKKDEASPHATNWFAKSAIAMPFARIRAGISSERTSHTQMPGPSD